MWFVNIGVSISLPINISKTNLAWIGLGHQLAVTYARGCSIGVVGCCFWTSLLWFALFLHMVIVLGLVAASNKDLSLVRL
jgi:hypothetical protein